MVAGVYEPNSAPTNRLLSFVRAFEEMNIETIVVFIEPNRTRDKIEQTYKYVTLKYLWDSSLVKNYIYDKLLAGFRVQRFCRLLGSGDKVFVFGASAYLHYFTTRRNVSIYHERTEHPDVVRLRFGFERNRYLSSCRKLKGLFVISTALKEFFLGVGIPSDKICIVNMTVDNTRFDGLQRDGDSERYIAYCGTASNNKDGVDRLIRAFGIVAQKHQDVKLYIIGKAPSVSDEAGNLKLIDELRLNDKVVFTGVKPAIEIPRLLINAVVLALARPDSLQAKNGFPTKLGEYLSTGNPVVVTKVGDIPLFLKDKDSALLVDADNIVEFANQLCWVLDNPKEAERIGANGRKVALRYFDSTLEAQKIVRYIFA